MKTIRTILATFGVTTLVYGILAMLTVRFDFTFAGRTIYQMFRDTGFAGLVLGIGCVLAVIILSIALAAFRDDDRNRQADEDDEFFYDVDAADGPADEGNAQESVWNDAIKQKQRAALQVQDTEPEDEDEEEDIVDLFSDDEDAEDEEPAFTEENVDTAPKAQRCLYCGAELKEGSRFCSACGKRA